MLKPEQKLENTRIIQERIGAYGFTAGFSIRALDVLDMIIIKSIERNGESAIDLKLLSKEEMNVGINDEFLDKLDKLRSFTNSITLNNPRKVNEYKETILSGGSSFLYLRGVLMKNAQNLWQTNPYYFLALLDCIEKYTSKGVEYLFQSLYYEMLQKRGINIEFEEFSRIFRVI